MSSVKSYANLYIYLNDLGHNEVNVQTFMANAAPAGVLAPLGVGRNF